MAHLSHLLFDLDGTLTDPKPGIVQSIQHALRKLKRPVPSDEDLLWCIGPPLRENLATLLSSSEPTLLEQAVAFYRERFEPVGMFENHVYPGVRETLARLKQMEYTLLVATSKPRLYAQKIVEHFGLAEYLAGVYGSELDGQRTDKRELLGFILSQEAIPASHALMVGDRRHDIVGAKRNGMWAGGVTYGYGTVEELTTAGADHIFHRPEEIAEFVLEL